MASLKSKSSTSGHWLSGNKAYSELINDQCSSDPRLRIRDPKCVERKTMWPNLPVRVRILSRSENGNFVVKGDFSDSDDLEVFLRGRNEPSAYQQTLYLVEAFDPPTVEVLGSYFQLHPSFFMEHERVKFSDQNTFNQADTILLPSSLSTRNHITLRYSEPIHIYQGIPRSHINCHTTGRHIKTIKSGGKILPVVILRRKCSVWKRDDNGISEIIVLCDPKVTILGSTKNRIPLPVDICPFQGGYVGFLPEKEEMKYPGGPPRSSMFDDLTFYLTNHAHLLINRSCADSVQIFINKIIAGHYWELANFIYSTVSYTQKMISRSGLTGFSVEEVETNWSDIQADERHSARYCKDLENIMLQLNIKPCAPSYARTVDWANCEEDFQFLLTEFKNLYQTRVSLSTSMTTLASIAGNRQAALQQKQSIREAKRTKAITFLGLIFIPLAYVCSLFSMADSFAPGGRLFWVYFLVAIPLVGLVALGNWLLDQGYNYDASSWSIHNLLDKLRNGDIPCS